MTASALDSEPLMMRRSRVMAVIGCSKRRYYDLVAQGHLTARALPGYAEKRVPKDQVLAFLNSPEPKTP